MERRIVTYTSHLVKTFYGKVYGEEHCAWFKDREKRPLGYQFYIRVGAEVYHSWDYPPGTTLTVTVEIQTPITGKLDSA